MQLILTIPKRVKASLRAPAITVLLCGGYFDPLKYLVAADELGYLTLWAMPQGDEGLNYSPVISFPAHTQSINILVSIDYESFINNFGSTPHRSTFSAAVAMVLFKFGHGKRGAPHSLCYHW